MNVPYVERRKKAITMSLLEGWKNHNIIIKECSHVKKRKSCIHSNISMETVYLWHTHTHTHTHTRTHTYTLWYISEVWISSQESLSGLWWWVICKIGWELCHSRWLGSKIDSCQCNYSFIVLCMFGYKQINNSEYIVGDLFAGCSYEYDNESSAGQW